MTTFKDFLGAKDVKWWNGITRTFARLTSTGGSLTQNKIGHMVDVLEVYGGGDAYTDVTLNTALGTVGSNACIFLLQPGTWVLSENVTIPATIALHVPRGTTLNIAAGKTLTINGTLEAGEYAIFSGTGTIAGTPKIRTKDPTWFSGTETDNLYPSNPFITWGSASPEAAVTAPVGSIYLRTTAGAGATEYYKESGAGNTGWIARTHIGANAIWHAGNDGAGSGLDADTVDGRNPGSISGIPTLDANGRVVEVANLVWDGVGNRSASPTPAADTVPVSDSTKGLLFGHSDGTNHIKTKIINIGDWNMDLNATVTVLHGLTQTNIRQLGGIIRNDDNTQYHSITPAYGSAGAVAVNVQYADATTIYLERLTAGTFDSISYDSTTYNRGWIIVTYVG